MSDFHSVTLKTIVEINGKQYTIESCDFSESVTEAICDGVCDTTAQDIIDFVTQC
jgi:hypothetical protein